MTDTTWMKQRVPSSVILGCEDEPQPGSPWFEERETIGGVGNVLSDHAAALTWKLCKEGRVTPEPMSKEAMVATVRVLLA